ncbi:hypothetical protein HJC23_011761 [Cyclotella cryptica]|uniref:Uncharacterized protein n=1 Tax=Cyclotella cryptica TaxID=29204 RepID=A0ABD3PGQ2_9STRA
MTTFASMISGLLGLTAWFLSLFGGVYCKFLSNMVTASTSPDEPITLNLGIWYYQGYYVANSTDGTVVYELCRSYPDDMNIDTKWRSARAFSTLALMVGGFVTIWAMYSGCSTPSKTLYRVGGILFMLTCLFQGLVLLFLNSSACSNNTLTDKLQEEMPVIDITAEDTCDMTAGAKCTIAATVLWFCAAIPAFRVDIPQRGAVATEKEKEKEAEADERTFDPDEHEVAKEKASVEVARGAEDLAAAHDKETEAA